MKVEVGGERFTPEIRSVVELNLLTAARDDGDGAVLDEVHFPAQRPFSYDQVSGLEDFETQLGQDHGHKMWVCVGKQRHVGYQAAAVIADNLLQGQEKEKTVGIQKVVCMTLS